MGVALPTFFIVWHKGTECVCKIWGATCGDGSWLETVYFKVSPSPVH